MKLIIDIDEVEYAFCKNNSDCNLTVAGKSIKYGKPVRDDEAIELGDEVQIKKTGMVGHVVNICPENDKVLYLIKCYVDGFREFDELTLDEFKFLRKKSEVTDEAPYVKQYRGRS